MSYPSPQSDTTDTTLPTPSLPSASSSRRPTILSPTLADDSHPHRHSMLSPIEPNDDTVKPAAGDTPGDGKDSGMIPSINVQMDETPTRPRRAGRTPSSGSASGGLNIRGLTLPTAGKITPSTPRDHERAAADEEDTDGLGALAPSPRVAAFKASLLQPSPEIPLSPAWQSFDASPGPSASVSARRASMNSPRGHAASPSMAFGQSPGVPSPLGPGARRFDPTPHHGIHARNLSLFFPSPGQPQASGRDVFGNEGAPLQADGPSVLLPAGEEKKVFGGKGGWSFGGQNGSGGATAGQTLSPDHAQSSKRRGHHHKHSLSHNFFSFLDPTVTNPALAPSPSSPSPRPSTPASTSFPTSVPIPMQSSTSLMASSPTLSPLPRKGLDPRTQLYLSFAVIEFLIGAGLWIEGQLSGWRCLAGVGYLSVFDAAGVALRTIREGDSWRSTRRPYGTARFMTLLYFAQTLFLVFASVYIAKESIETVMLGDGAHAHGGGHGHGHGHGSQREHAHGEDGHNESSMPLLLLALSSAASLFSGSVLGNHSKLVESVGSLFVPSALAKARISNKLRILRNPFSLTVAGGSAAVLIGAITLPSSSLHVLDSALSLVLTIATASLAYPSARAFALVLLQTAPSPSSVQMTALRQSLRSIADDRRILGIGSTRVWMIASSGCDSSDATHSHLRSASVDTTPSVPSSPVTSNFPFPRKSSGPAKDVDVGNTRLSVTVVVHVNDNVGDKDVLDVTKYVWNRVSAAVGEGEVSISIKRGWEGMETS